MSEERETLEMKLIEKHGYLRKAERLRLNYLRRKEGDNNEILQEV